MINIAILQNTLAPYRVPLFEKIAENKDIQLILILMSEEKPNYPQWKKYIKNTNLNIVLADGIRITLTSKSLICVNPSVVRILIDNKPDIVICSGFTISTIFAILYKFLTRTPVAIWSEETIVTEKHRPANYFRKIIRKLIVKYADGFIDSGTESRQYIKGLLSNSLGKTFSTAFNCIESDKFQSNLNIFKSHLSEYHRFKSHFPAKNILFSGRLIELKGINSLLKVYKNIVDIIDYDVGLIILGQGHLNDKINFFKQSHDLNNIFVEGFKEGYEYIKYFAISDLFILLSDYDCNPLVIFEALTAGLPLICSKNAGNASDFVIEGKNGHIVNPHDIDDIVMKSISILNLDNKEYFRQISQRLVKKANYNDAASSFIRIAKLLKQ